MDFDTPHILIMRPRRGSGEHIAIEIEPMRISPGLCYLRISAYSLALARC